MPLPRSRAERLSGGTPLGIPMRKLVAITAAFSCLVFAGSASAVNRSFFGVVSAKQPTAQDYSRMGSARVGTLRLIFNWASIQPSGPGAYDWSSYDSMIGQAAQQGIRVLPTIYGSPRWAAAQPQHPPSPAHYDEFTAFCRAAAARYGSNGSFWALNPSAPQDPHHRLAALERGQLGELLASESQSEGLQAAAGPRTRRDQGCRPEGENHVGGDVRDPGRARAPSPWSSS